MMVQRKSFQEKDFFVFQIKDWIYSYTLLFYKPHVSIFSAPVFSAEPLLFPIYINLQNQKTFTNKSLADDGTWCCHDQFSSEDISSWGKLLSDATS